MFKSVVQLIENDQPFQQKLKQVLQTEKLSDIKQQLKQVPSYCRLMILSQMEVVNQDIMEVTDEMDLEYTDKVSGVHQIALGWILDWIANRQPTTQSLEQNTLVRGLYKFGFQYPTEFYVLLEEQALKATKRLGIWLLLQEFLVLQDAPTYYLVESRLFHLLVDTLVVERDQKTRLTGIGILTIILPIVSVRSCEKVDKLSLILLRNLEMHPEIDYFDEQLRRLLVVLYGMFPWHTIDCTQKYMSGIIPSIQVQVDFLPAHVEQRDGKPLLQEWIQSLRIHSKLITTSIDTELTEPWFKDLEASEIIVQCFSLEPEQPLIQLEKQELSMQETISQILYLNRNISLSHEPQLVFYLLLNETFFKECMRQYHLMHIKRLRKNQIHALAQHKELILQVPQYQESNELLDLKQELDQTREKLLRLEQDQEKQKLRAELQEMQQQLNILQKQNATIKTVQLEPESRSDAVQIVQPKQTEETITVHLDSKPVVIVQDARPSVVQSVDWQKERLLMEEELDQMQEKYNSLQQLVKTLLTKLDLTK
ncbi:hypothetical protein EDD86DRAFT_276157 [Gorgonomyces haynaldii]|nr:hypothetical protein EDD86DRAFT_276157 [Gorgonomyces haynaldii]